MSRLFIPIRGATFLLPTPEENDSDSKHLFVQLTKPVKQNDGEKVLLASFSTKRPGGRYDKTCVISKGESRFLSRESYVDYRYTRIESVERIRELLVTGEAKYIEGMIEEYLVDLICKGLFKSEQTPDEALEFYKAATS